MNSEDKFLNREGGEIDDPLRGHPTPMTIDNNVVYDLNMQVSNEKEEKEC